MPKFAINKALIYYDTYISWFCSRGI